MEYFKLGGVDYSRFVSGLNVTETVNYNSQTNAAGNTVIDYINSKYELEVSFIPMSKADVNTLWATGLGGISVQVSFLNPKTAKEETINCVAPTKQIEWLTLSTKEITKPFSLTFSQL